MEVSTALHQVFFHQGETEGVPRRCQKLTLAVPALKMKRLNDVPAETNGSGLRTKFHNNSFRIGVTNEVAATV